MRRLALVPVLLAGFAASVPASADSTTLVVNRASWDIIEWQHEPLPGSFSAGAISLHAWDIDSTSGEVDYLYARDSASGTWVFVGQLLGSDDSYSTTSFTLPGVVLDDVSAGRSLKVDVAVGWVNRTTWAAQVLRSTITATPASSVAATASSSPIERSTSRPTTAPSGVPTSSGSNWDGPQAF